ncbi:SGNH/GDSL hydrolase family protein [Streptomyces fractus]|uniref:SGNH/GDSL hydrolase family protein n=1 Tax=Streptomyces fractus TaxID=641806 RepID=UPI003CF172D4
MPLLRYAAALGAALLALISADTATASPHARPAEHYVALGDSYTSGTGILPHTDTTCTRSARNYPTRVAEQIGPASFVDVSCGGATTEHLWKPQNGVPPQLDALGADTTLVTLGMGGNDIGFGEILAQCVTRSASDPTGTPCRGYHTSDGEDELARRITVTAPKIAAALDGIRDRAPHARVMVVGYPVIVPHEGTGCWPYVPIADGDVPYLRIVEQQANAMLSEQARSHGAEFVDTYKPTVGHDACQVPKRRYVEGLLPARPAAPFHPNAEGAATIARAVIAAYYHQHAVVLAHE